MDICAELRSHWPSQDDPGLDDEDKCCLLLGLRAAAEIERLQMMLKMAYCRNIGSDSPHGLDSCDDYRDWLKMLTPNAALTGAATETEKRLDANPRPV